MANQVIFTMTGIDTGGGTEGYYESINNLFQAIEYYGHFLSGDETDGVFELYDNSSFVLNGILTNNAKCISSQVHVVNGQIARPDKLVFEAVHSAGDIEKWYVSNYQMYGEYGDYLGIGNVATIEKLGTEGEKFLNQDGVGAIRNWVNGGISDIQSQIGSLHSLTTDHKDNLVNAINEVYEKSGEPFRVKKWANSFNVEIPTCTEDLANTAIPKMVFSIDNIEGADYQIVGMISYEVFDAVSRLNVWPVCQFTGNGQKELSVRWVCAGTTRKTARRINAWVLLKHR